MQRHGGLDLIAHDLGDQLAPHGEVRIGEVVDLAREHLGDTVCPATVAARLRRVRVADALGERVADRDESPPGMGILVVELRGSDRILICHPALLHDERSRAVEAAQ